MDLKERLVFCKKCENRKFDSAIGIVCALNGKKPEFESSCSDFVIDAKEEQKIKNTTYTTEKTESESKSVWMYVGLALIIIKIVFRFLRD